MAYNNFFVDGKKIGYIIDYQIIEYTIQIFKIGRLMPFDLFQTYNQQPIT